MQNMFVHGSFIDELKEFFIKECNVNEKHISTVNKLFKKKEKTCIK